MKEPRCASCLAGEIENEDVCGYFVGYLANESRPFRGWLCADHEEMHATDNDLLGKPPLKRTRGVS